MSKPLFFTGRKQIARSDVAIELLEQRGKPTRFDASIDLSRYHLPENASVVVEAYHTAYYERFPSGTVGDIVSETRELKGIEFGDRPNFRVKVISSDGTVNGRLLAAIDEIRPQTDDGGAAGSLLPIVPKTRQQIGDEFWRVHFVPADEKSPELWVNVDVPGLFPKLKNQDPFVTGLIMPEVLRQVLRGFVEYEEPWTDEGRLGQWLALAQELLPDKFEEWDSEDVEGSRQKRRDWIDEVVKRFALLHRLCDRYGEEHQQPANGDNDD